VQAQLLGRFFFGVFLNLQAPHQPLQSFFSVIVSGFDFATVFAFLLGSVVIGLRLLMFCPLGAWLGGGKGRRGQLDCVCFFFGGGDLNVDKLELKALRFF